MQSPSFFSLEQIIDRQPLTVTLQTPLVDAIGLMQNRGNSCKVKAEEVTYSNSSCVLIVEERQLRGIFTERDLVKLIAADIDLAEVAIIEVMIRDVVTLTDTGSEDIFTALDLLQSHYIRHLPIVDSDNNLLGLTTVKNLRQKLQPINMMKWRKVAEVMKDKVFYASPDDSIRRVAKLMATNQISCVAIAKTEVETDLVQPIGIITERDIVQCQNLNLDLEQPARELMSTPLFLVSPEDDLWQVHQQMQQRRVRRLLVAGNQGELAGIVTQTSLLQVFDPAEMYEVVETLRKKVYELEADKAQLLENRQAELETEIEQRTAALESTNQRLQLEANLRREGEQRYNSILSSLEDLVWSVEPDTFKVIYMNSAAERIYQRPPEEFYDNPNLWLEVVHPEDRDRVAEFARTVLATDSAEIEYRIIRSDGEVRWLYDRATVTRNREGTPIRLDGIATDISDRKRREAILKDIATGVSIEVGENFFHSLTEYLSRTLQVDFAFACKLIKPNRDSLQTLAVYGEGKTLENFVYQIANAPCGDAIERGICIYPEAVRQHFPNMPLLEAMIAESYAGMPIFDLTGEIIGLIGIVHTKQFDDLSLIEEVLKIFATRATAEIERQQAESQIRQQAALLDIANDAIMVRDSHDRILFWNRGAEKLYGWSKAEALNRNAKELFNRKSTIELSKIHQAVSERGEWQGELNQVTKADKEVVVNSRWTLVKDQIGDPQAYLVVKTDITEQKQLEAQFLRTQRLESLGTLAGGIAHDLNNILAPILGFAKLLPLKLPDADEQTKGFFKIMETNAQRGTALVKQILTFSRGLEGERGIVQIRHLINEIARIIDETFPKSIELILNVPKNLWTVNADINQLHQVLMNLCVNARDAMPDGGKLIIEAENFTVDREYARLHLDAAEGNYLCITVTDTGVGIPPEIIDRIFEPFFTTKEIGHGTGLGLSTVIGIVKSYDGFVDVVSKATEVRGTRVNIFISAADAASAIAEADKSISQGNGELILVVDDETSMLEVTRATLETYNYQVVTANNGIEAVATYANNKDAIALIIMDIMMPGMDGKIAIRTLKQINPEVRVIAVSGLITSQEIINQLDEKVMAFLSKPYSNDELLETVYKIVSG